MPDLVELMGQGHWALKVFLVALIIVTINLVVRLSLNRLHKRVERTETVWDEALFLAVNSPLRLLIWIIGIGILLDMLEPTAGNILQDYLPVMRKVAIMGTIAWFLVRLIHNVEVGLVHQGELRGEPIDQTTVEAVGKLVRLAVLITTGLVILQTLGFSISGVLAFGGVGGLAVGFAAKDMLANFFGGLTVYLDRPFATGDWIRSPEKDIEGVVEKIGWRTTRIRKFDKRPIYVPNSLFTSLVVENPSRMTHRRIYETIGVRYDDASRLAGIIDEVRDYLKAHAEIDGAQTIIVNFNSFGPSSLDFFVYCLTITTNWVRYHEVKQEVLMDIHGIIEARGAEVAFPTRTLHIVAPEQALEMAGE